MGRRPTTETVVEDFGLESQAFRRVSGAFRDSWASALESLPFAECFRRWAQCMADVYGTAVASDDLFVRQTYLATVAKLIARKRIGGSEHRPEADEIVEILDGTYFTREGIEGFCDRDFFSWIALPLLREMGETTVQLLWSLLEEYDLDQLSEDVLKSLYEQLVDPEPRHGLGEYYTPDWLAARMVRRLLDKNPAVSFLDPACGSGSFLYAVLREKRSRLGDSAETLNHVIDSVSGIDINPLAVVVARTNYILALGGLVAHRPKPMAVPVHLADAMCSRCGESSGLPPRNPGFNNRPSTEAPRPYDRVFDVVAGNPPWISYRFLDPARQRIMRHLVMYEYELLDSRADLITHMELATLFLIRSSELYSKPGGTISFVLPRSIFSSDQHHRLRTREFRFSRDTEMTLACKEIWDCQSVQPLFDVPTCVLTAEKAPRTAVSYPIQGEILRGKLNRRNASLQEAVQSLRAEPVQYYLHRGGKHSFWATEEPAENRGPSPYKRPFEQGASMVPRSFWFVDLMFSPAGIDRDLPRIATAQYARSLARPAYKDVSLTGNVERRFLYATLLAADLIPFGHFGFRTVVLPIEPEEDGYRLLDAESARDKGLLHLAQWLEKVELEWQARRGRKAAGVSALQWLDYRGKLTGQNPQSLYRVIYNTSGTFLTAAVVKRDPLPHGPAGQQVSPGRFVADTKTYYYQTDNENEVFYLAAVLNAPAVNDLIKPMQSRGSFGPRDIHKKVFELPIPRYDQERDLHRRFASLGRHCTDRVRQWLTEEDSGLIRSIGRLRSKTRAMLETELKELDALVETLIK